MPLFVVLIAIPVFLIILLCVLPRRTKVANPNEPAIPSPSLVSVDVIELEEAVERLTDGGISWVACFSQTSRLRWRDELRHLRKQFAGIRQNVLWCGKIGNKFIDANENAYDLAEAAAACLFALDRLELRIAIGIRLPLLSRLVYCRCNSTFGKLSRELLTQYQIAIIGVNAWEGSELALASGLIGNTARNVLTFRQPARKVIPPQHDQSSRDQLS